MIDTQPWVSAGSDKKLEPVWYGWDNIEMYPWKGGNSIQYLSCKHGTKARVGRFLVAGIIHFWELLAREKSC
jgi:hypothetical protein